MGINSIAKFLMRVPVKMMACLPQNGQVLAHYMNCMVDEYNCRGDQYSLLYQRPKKAACMEIEDGTEIQRKTAIVMQGPLTIEGSFTLETVRMYQKLFPNTIVIISTWTGENKQMLQSLAGLDNCYLVISDLPEHSGILNLNYQIVSTMEGLRKAKQLGKEYVFKSRCDHRFMRKGLMEYLVNLCMRFPVDESIKYQNCRIVCGGVDGTVCFGPIG